MDTMSQLNQVRCVCSNVIPMDYIQVSLFSFLKDDSRMLNISFNILINIVINCVFFNKIILILFCFVCLQRLFFDDMCRIGRFLFDNNVGEFTVVVFQTEIVFIGEVVNQGILAQKIIYKGYMKETNEIKGSSDFSVQIILQCIDSVIECCLNDGLYQE